jgi:signal transduction histidine kinase
MREFFKKALRKLNKLTAEQIQELLVSAAGEIDRLETVLDSITEGILVCDTDNCLVLANKYAWRFLPADACDPEHSPVWNIIRDEKVRDFFETTLSNRDRVEDREFYMEFKGIQRLLSISVLPLVRDHQITGSLIYVEDITEKRNKEAQLRRAENLASLTTLAAGVAHEIKNPLGSLSIHIQLIQKAMARNREIYGKVHSHGKDDGSGNTESYFNLLDKYIGVVNEEIDRLNRIVVDFLFAVRPMTLEYREGDINALIGELTEFVWHELGQARIKCTLDLDPDLRRFRFDERYIKQVLLNLIKNAIAAMPNGGTLSITTKEKDGEVHISVKDTGIGIPEDNLPKIFEPYFTTRDNGSGLGLTLVFKIIREHRGEITVKSKEGEGTTFFIVLPIPQKERRLITFGGGGL